MKSQTIEYATMPADVAPKSQRGLHIFACILVVLTVGLIAAGAMVTSTGSGLSVPDWPTTYGENMFMFHPSKWVGGIFYEHGHRLLASSIGFLTIVLAVFAHVRGGRKAVRVLGWVALATVIAQGILGGMTVKYMLPTWISVFHACLAQTFLCVLTTIAVLTHPRWSGSTRSSVALPKRSHSSAMAPLALIVVVFAQLIAGAIMRHTQSGLAVPDFPLAYGQVIPSLSEKSLVTYNDARAFELQLSPVTSSQIVFHLVHRGGAVLVLIAVIACAVSIHRNDGRGTPTSRAIGWIALLVIIQATLGAYTIWTAKLPVVATAHVAVGAATLAASWRCFLLSRMCPPRSLAEVNDEALPIDVAVSGVVA
ncbi:MAG: COX15/CtaA family protein [Phycisphaerales bacterium]|nr:COX15/CtaA family protein [Phycisphaerales bacterium]MCB9854272.1 COX15/CtaA family protein [Phycisphaerales bacterium]